MPNPPYSLVNQNQLRHFGTVIQDNPYSSDPMNLLNPGKFFIACLNSIGTVIHLTTWYTKSEDLKKFPHVHITLQQPWDPQNVRVPGVSQSQQEEIDSRAISAVGRTISTLSLCANDCSDSEDESEIFNKITFNDRSINIVLVLAADAD